MKILHINNCSYWDGHTNRILNECIGLKNRNIDISLFAKSSKLITRALDNNIKLVGPPNKETIKNYDIIHTHCIEGMSLISRIKSSNNIFIAGIHFNHNNTINSFLPKNIDKIVCVSDSDAEQYKKQIPHYNDKIISIPTCIDVDFFSNYNTKNIKKDLQFKDNNNPIVGSLIRKNKIKGYETLLELSNIMTDVNFLLVGNGMEEFNKINPNIISFGINDDIRKFLNVMDIYIQPSFQESLGTSILEAAATKKPIIASNIGGIPDFIEHNKTGLLFDPLNINEITTSIELVLNNKELSSKLSNCAYEKVSNQFNVNIMIDKIFDLYNKF